MGRITYDFSDNIQRGILKLYKSDDGFHIEVSDIVKPDYFEFPVHQNIYLVAQDFRSKYGKLPTNDQILELCKTIKDESENISEYTDELFLIDGLNDQETECQTFYLDLAEEFARHAAVKEALQECVKLVRQKDIGGCEEVMREAMLVSRNVNVGQDYFSSVGDRWARQQEYKANGMKFATVFPTHNQYLEGGNDAKELCIVAAPPGVGKSLYLVNQAVKALTEGKKVLYVSLEMSEDKIARRVDSIATVLPNSSLNSHATQLDLHKRLQVFQERCPGSRLFIKEYPTGMASVTTIRALLAQLNMRHQFTPDLIIVDYLELLHATRPIDQEYLSQQRIARELRGLAQEQRCLVWTATQTNREGSKAAIIDQIHLGDSFGKIREADWGISLNQTAEEYDKGEMRVFVMKSRDGKQKYTIKIRICYSTLRMEEQITEEDVEEAVSSL